MNLSQIARLSDLRIPSRANLTLHESGIDSLESCFDRSWFNNYPHKVLYEYNSRGFRDDEWPDDLCNAIWCIGDSFTVGLGSPLEHTWVRILQKKAKKRCINISMDGASNSWIARRAALIASAVAPENIVIHWSYLNRIEHPDTTKSDEDRRRHFDKESLAHESVMITDFANAVNVVKESISSTNVIFSVIPQAGWPLNGNALNHWRQILAEYGTIPEFPIIDFARDSHHYDINTATNFVNEILTRLK